LAVSNKLTTTAQTKGLTERVLAYDRGYAYDIDPEIRTPTPRHFHSWVGRRASYGRDVDFISAMVEEVQSRIPSSNFLRLQTTSSGVINWWMGKWPCWQIWKRFVGSGLVLPKAKTSKFCQSANGPNIGQPQNGGDPRK